MNPTRPLSRHIRSEYDTRESRGIPLSTSVKNELDRRYAEYLANPAEGSSWEKMKRRLEAQRVSR
jgi:putative addiction module component (TIGR02574 family)